MKVTKLNSRANTDDPKPIWWIMPIVLLLLSTPTIADEGFQVEGYYKSFFTAFDSPVPNDSTIGAVVNRLRLNFSYAPTDALSFDLSYNFAPRVQDPTLFTEPQFAVAVDPYGYRVADLDSQVYPAANQQGGSFGIFQNLDRASVQFSTAFADISIGRQAVAWGSARVINPTDVVGPYTHNELDTEDRIGVDAVRVQIPIGAMGEFDGGCVFGKDFGVDRSVLFLRSQLNAVETDFSIVLLRFREHLMAGFDMARGIGPVGFWFEGAYVSPNDSDDSNKTATDYLRASVGLDYSLGGATYGFIEYHFSSAGAKQPENYLSNFTEPAYTDGAVYLMGRHYLAPGMAYQVTPLVNLSLQTLLNISDLSTFLSSQMEYNIAQDIYLAIGALIGIGNPPETEDEAPQFRSEFGGYPNVYFSSFRFYF